MPPSPVLDYLNTGRYDKNIMDYYANTQAGTWFHEMFHMGKLVTDPRALDYAYGPEDVYRLAIIDNTKQACVNADSFHYTGLAVLGQRTFGLSRPPIPGFFYNGLDTSTASVPFNASLTGLMIDLTGTDFLPEGMNTTQTFDVNPDYWEIMPVGNYPTFPIPTGPTSTSSLPVVSSSTAPAHTSTTSSQTKVASA